MFKILDGRKYFYQWDINRKIIVSDETIKEVHFCNRQGECSLVCEVYTENDLNVVDVPNIILQKSYCINVYAYDGEATRHSKTFLVKARTKPEDYVYTETEVKNYESLKAYIDESIKEINISGGNITVDNAMSTTSENPVQNKVVKKYIDDKAIKIISAEDFSFTYPWELESGIYTLDNPDGAETLYLDFDGNYSISDGMFFIADVPSLELKAIYAFGFNSATYEQNIIALLLDSEGNVEQDMSAGLFINERMSALESAVAELALMEE